MVLYYQGHVCCYFELISLPFHLSLHFSTSGNICHMSYVDSITSDRSMPPCSLTWDLQSDQPVNLELHCSHNQSPRTEINPLNINTCTTLQTGWNSSFICSHILSVQLTIPSTHVFNVRMHSLYFNYVLNLGCNVWRVVRKEVLGHMRTVSL